MDILGYLVVALIVIIGLAIAYRLRARRHQGLSNESPEARRLSALRNEQARTFRRTTDDPRSGYDGGGIA
jgi:hypothetical protein